MSDELKRRQSRPSKRVARLDARAEPDSARLPEPEAVITRARERTKPPLPREPPSLRVRPASQRETLREVRTAVPLSLGRDSVREPEEDATTASLRRQLATLQSELALTQRRLATEQEARSEDADRLAELLSANVETAAEKATNERLAQAEANVAAARARLLAVEESGQAARDTVVELEKRVQKNTEALAKAAADLEHEHRTSQWLRTAGEQATRELADARAQLTAIETKYALTLEATKDLKAAEDDRIAARTELANVHAELLRLKASAATAEEEAAKLRESLQELGATAKTATARVAELEEEARQALADAQRVAEVEKAELQKAHEQALAEERAKSATATQAALAKAAAEQGAFAKDAEEQVATMAKRLSSTVAALDALRVEHERSLKQVATERVVAGERAQAAAKHLDGATELVAALNRSLEALETNEEEVTKLRALAATKRHALADQAVALRLALSRAGDAADANK